MAAVIKSSLIVSGNKSTPTNVNTVLQSYFLLLSSIHVCVCVCARASICSVQLMHVTWRDVNAFCLSHLHRRARYFRLRSWWWQRKLMLHVQSHCWRLKANPSHVAQPEPETCPWHELYILAGTGYVIPDKWLYPDISRFVSNSVPAFCSYLFPTHELSW